MSEIKWRKRGIPTAKKKKTRNRFKNLNKNLRKSGSNQTKSNVKNRVNKFSS